MRKVIYSVGASLDGYIADPQGGVDWLDRATSKAKGEDFGMTAFFKSLDTVLMGRRTYEIAVKMGMAKGHPGMKNYIFSRTLPAGERDGVQFVSTDPADFVAQLKTQPGKNIWLIGGGELAREFLRRNALDVITLGIVPRMIGGGIPTFPPGFDETELELTELKEYKGGVVGLTYRVVHADESAERPAPQKQAGKTKSVAKAKPVPHPSSAKRR
jgi:dihydrofolate reductase